MTPRFSSEVTKVNDLSIPLVHIIQEILQVDPQHGKIKSRGATTSGFLYSGNGTHKIVIGLQIANILSGDPSDKVILIPR